VPILARLKILFFILLVFILLGLLSLAVIGLGLPIAVQFLLFVILLSSVIIALDAFYPKVNLFVPAIVDLSKHTSLQDSVALTFDDGPVRPYTKEILDILERYQVKASFFCIADNVVNQPELAREVLAAGHTLGNHTQTHKSLMFASKKQVYQEISTAQQSIEQATGKVPRFFRCPKGYKSPIVASVIRRLGLRLVGYGYPIFDVENPPEQELIERVLSRVKGGDIIVMHDGFPAYKPGHRDSLVSALPKIIEGIQARGLSLVSLDQALPE